ncbi:hypothetical protein GGI25_006317 [Coemansia spiralis]|uniref:Threonyl/alanyl tRNA synthetase SAD domain-containing protein n=2 Tax=Coemansia TaxID=4863 RepID=A0A9W8KVM0_9FUNG|nr:Threonyl/alanyl tRNA synthetase [Coemansia spiralis]KAJ1986466.1 hypothetical protein EDC05_006284 [Coemansia umbellata]KAJ2618764.1 hypothetical protein GGI26_006365 [Coemansia sp. RSA 1358]KAJ2668903.1 hypothetical protein GGI25_006317 [Coemansia spiralis]
MATKLCYFDNTYQFEGQATLEKLIDTSNDQEGCSDEVLAKTLSKHPFAVILDQTLFYPQGGGQPTDVGTIRFDADTEFAVRHVFMHKGLVYHQGDFAKLGHKAVPGCVARLFVDKDTRLQNARCHSGGHVIFSIIRDNKEWSHMNEKKGHHFADGAYVEFQGILPELESVESFQQKVDSVVNQHVPVKSFTREVDGAPLRYIQVGEYLQNACGGTHVRNTGELGRICIKKIARRNGQNITKISYKIENLGS